VLFILETHSINLLFTEDEIDVLRNFTSQDRLALSVYLDLGSPDSTETAIALLQRLIEQELQSVGASGATRQSLQEDIELTRLYLTTNCGRRTKSLAVFSCAGELFWRTYSLPLSVVTQVYLGRRFVTGPLFSMLGDQPCGQADAEESEKMIA
jgi:hypothetical protein